MKEPKKQTMELDVPAQLKLLCDLLGTTPEEVVQGFINDLSRAEPNHGSDERLMAMEYFMRCPYGYHCYEYEQILSMFDGLDWLWNNSYDTGRPQSRQLRHEYLEGWYCEWKEKQQQQ